MPGGDRTGPLGEGPMTGRGAGYCAGYPMPGYANPQGGRGVAPGYGRGFGRGGGRGRGAGFGRGMGRGFRGGRGADPYYNQPLAPTPMAQPAPAYGYPTAGNELEELKAQEQYYKAYLRDLKKRRETLERESAAPFNGPQDDKD